MKQTSAIGSYSEYATGVDAWRLQEYPCTQGMYFKITPLFSGTEILKFPCSSSGIEIFGVFTTTSLFKRATILKNIVEFVPGRDQIEKKYLVLKRF